MGMTQLFHKESPVHIKNILLYIKNCECDHEYEEKNKRWILKIKTNLATRHSITNFYHYKFKIFRPIAWLKCLADICDNLYYFQKNYKK